MNDAEDRVIRLDFGDFESHTRIELDLQKMADSAGQYEYDRNMNGKVKRVVMLPMANAKKICRMIVEHGTSEDFGKCQKYFKSNTKLMKVWSEEMERGV